MFAHIHSFIIQSIAQWLPTAQHVAQLRLVSREWRDALDLARIPQVSPRALMMHAIRIGDIELCKSAREIGARILARVASRAVDDELRELWFKTIWNDALREAARYGKRDIARLLVSWLPHIIYSDIASELRNGAVIGGGSRWHDLIPPKIDCTTVEQYHVSRMIGMSADRAMIRAQLRTHVRGEYEHAEVIRGVLDVGNLQLFADLMCSYQISEYCFMEIALAVLSHGYIDTFNAMLNRPPFNVQFADLLKMNIASCAGRSGSIDICARILALDSLDRARAHHDMLTHAAFGGRRELCEWLINTCEQRATSESIADAIIDAAITDRFHICCLLRDHNSHCFRDYKCRSNVEDICCRSPHLASRILSWLVKDGADLGSFLHPRFPHPIAQLFISKFLVSQSSSIAMA